MGRKLFSKSKLDDKTKRKLERMKVKTLEDRLFYLIKTNDLSQSEIAFRLNVNKSEITMWMNPEDRHKPLPHQIEKLEDILNVEKGTIVGDVPIWEKASHKEKNDYYYRKINEYKRQGRILERKMKALDYLDHPECEPHFQTTREIERNLLDLAASIQIDLKLVDGKIAIVFPDAGIAGETVNDFLEEWNRKRESLKNVDASKQKKEWEELDMWRASIFTSPHDGYYIKGDDAAQNVDALPVVREQRVLDAALPPRAGYVDRDPDPDIE